MLATDAAHVYGGLMASLTSWAELRGVPYEGVPVGTIKQHATGKGNAPKQAMINAARARGFSPADDNEADAIAILHLGHRDRREAWHEAFYTPRGYGGRRRDPEQVKRDGWQEQGVLAVSVGRPTPDLAGARAGPTSWASKPVRADAAKRGRCAMADWTTGPCTRTGLELAAEVIADCPA